MKKIFLLATAAFLFTGVSFAHDGNGKKCGKGSDCCKDMKDCKKDMKDCKDMKKDTKEVKKETKKETKAKA
jgi:hypothetical protein